MRMFRLPYFTSLSLSPELRQPAAADFYIRVHLYVTRPPPAREPAREDAPAPTAGSAAAALLRAPLLPDKAAAAGWAAGAGSGPAFGWPVAAGRPDLPAILAGALREPPAPAPAECAVLACGPPGMLAAAAAAAAAAGAHWHLESFGL
jgi:hypothetical protein